MPDVVAVAPDEAMEALVYRTSPIKRRRRTQVEMDTLRDMLYEILAAEHPVTCRGAFYAMVTRGLIEKVESEYRSTVCRLLAKMRLDNMVPFDWIADNTRWVRRPITHDSVDAALRATVAAYRRALWNDQSAYVEIWCEKDALAGVIYEVTDPLDVPLMVTRGFASLSFVHSAAMAIQAVGRPAFLYYFGDYDPAGLDISRNAEARLREFAPNCEIHFQRMAVTLEQITEWALPTRPTKGRADNFPVSVELDAIRPTQLRALVEGCITRHLDPDVMKRTRAIEQAERAALLAFIKNVTTRDEPEPEPAAS